MFGKKDPFNKDQRSGIAMLDTAISKLPGVRKYVILFDKRIPEIEVRVIGGDRGNIGRCIAFYVPELVTTNGESEAKIKLAGQPDYKTIFFTHNPEKI